MLSHDHPALVGRLTGRLLAHDPEGHVVVEHQADGPSLKEHLSADPRLVVRYSPRAGGWGGFGLVSVVLAAIAEIRRTLDPDWLILLSGQDYPIRPLEELKSMLGQQVFRAPGLVPRMNRDLTKTLIFIYM